MSAFVSVAFVVLGTVFALAAALAVVRIIHGPSILDRMIASDVLIAIIMGCLAADMVLRHTTYALPIMLVLALFGMVGSISVARYVSKKDSP